MPAGEAGKASWAGAFERRVRLGRPIEDEQIVRIPAKRGVALLTASDLRPILLLPAADMRTRIRNRLRDPSEEERRAVVDLHEITTDVLYVRTDSHFETNLAYFELARAIWPRKHRQMVSFRPPWVVHVDPGGDVPAFRRVREPDVGGVCLGPFGSARKADRFIAALENAFRLCRDPRCLAEAPRATTCTYGQMGKCLRPCDGTIGLDAYREHLGRAVAFAAGRDTAVRDRIEQRMKRAAAELDYEQASACKARLEALDAVGENFAHVGPVERFRYVSVQRGPNRRTAKVFLLAGGRYAEVEPLRYPLEAEQLAAALRGMDDLAACSTAMGTTERWRLGLFNATLHSSPARRGVMAAWDERLAVEDLAETIEQNRDLLKLRPPRKRHKSKEANGSPSAPPSSDTDKDA